ncbi:MAG: hypothetical protein AAB898_02215 [Patescibacteria group bacterium]
MKNPAKLIAALIIVVAVVLIIIFSFPGDNQPNSSVGDRVQSQDGTAELVDFFTALADQRYAHAAQYVQCSCEGSYCMMEQASPDQIAAQLATWCVDFVCQPVEVDTVGGEETGKEVRIHEVAFLNTEGNRQPLCFSDDCSVQKLTTSFRVRKQNGLWYVVDEPPLRVTPRE